MQTLTYHNDPAFKADFVRMAKLHREQDRYMVGTFSGGGDGFKGCSVGCSVRSLEFLGRGGIGYGDHAGLAMALGWPEWLCHLQDAIFEGLPDGEREAWTEELAEAVPTGKDISRVKFLFCAYLMRDNIARVRDLEIDDALKTQVVCAISGVLALHEQAAVTGDWDDSAARSAARSAWSAAGSAESAESAARSADSAAWSAAVSAKSAARSADSDAKSAAWCAARSDARSAVSAAWCAAWSAGSAARSAAYSNYAKALLKLLQQA